MKLPLTSCVILLMVCQLSCTDSGINKDFSGIEDPQARWQAYNITNYVLIQTQICFCDSRVPMRVVVTNNRVTSVANLINNQPIPVQNWSQFKTIDELFAIVKSVNKDSVAYFRVEYDSKYGYPKDFFLDPSIMMADEEFGYITSLDTFY